MARILIVEDDYPTMALFRLLMEKGGYEVSIAHNAQDVLIMLGDGKVPDLMILDVMLPGMDGLTLCRQMRAQEINIPILMMSALAGEENKKAGLAAGATDYLSKPLLQYDLIEKVRNLLAVPPG